MTDRLAGDGRVPSGRGSADPREDLGAVYDRCAESLYRYAVMVLADPAEAEDAVQQAFAKLISPGSRARRIASYDGYLRQAVRHECVCVVRPKRGPEHSGVPPGL